MCTRDEYNFAMIVDAAIGTNGNVDYEPNQATYGLTHGMNNLHLSPFGRKRASSFKKPKAPPSDVDVYSDDDMRPRTCSMPTRNTIKRPNFLGHNTLHLDVDNEIYTLRSFSTTSKGVVVNRGDSLRSRSTNSVYSSGSELFPLSPSSRTSSSLSRESLGAGSDTVFRVAVLGSAGVGKTAITQQFMTSEYLGGFDTSIDGDQEKTVSVLLDGKESVLSFLEPTEDQDVKSWKHSDAFIVVYSCDDRESFDRAITILFTLRKQLQIDNAVIFVGNKSDLVRSRVVPSTESVAVANTYNCKFIETSVVLNMKVDELLVGIVKQIRIQIKNDSDTGCASKGKKVLKQIFKKDSLTKSCENLFK